MIIDDSNKKIQELNQKIDILKKELIHKKVEMENFKLDLQVILAEKELEGTKKEKNCLIEKVMQIKTNFLNKEKKEIEFLKNILCKDPNIPKEMKEFVERKEETVKNMELEIGYLKSILNKKN